MALYVIGDTHLSLSSNKPMDVFGARWKNHTEKLCGLWKNIVSPEDTVVIAGDISWGLTVEEAADDLKLLADLPGTKILMKGNHDFWWTSLKKNEDFFKASGIDSIRLIQNNSINVEDFTVCGTRGWYSDPQSNPHNNCDNKKIIAREVGRLRMSLTHALQHGEGRELAVFMHFPPVFSDFVCRELVDVLHEFGVSRCYFGHIHGSYKLPSVTVFEDIELHLISADYLDFRPKLIKVSQKQ